MTENKPKSARETLVEKMNEGIWPDFLTDEQQEFMSDLRLKKDKEGLDEREESILSELDERKHKDISREEMQILLQDLILKGVVMWPFKVTPMGNYVQLKTLTSGEFQEIRGRMTQHQKANAMFAKTEMDLMNVACAIVSFDGTPIGNTIEEKLEWLKSKPAVISDKITMAYNHLNGFMQAMIDLDDVKN